MTTPNLADLIFPSAATDGNKILGDIRRSALSIGNRLRSIEQDATFVQQVADAYRLPLIANERCGSWYVPLERKVQSAYFKSTDGHTGQWSFSLRRLNLQILETVAEHGGCIIVDSTRRGKTMPDALSKTVPIWIAVLNRFLFPDEHEAHQLYTTDNVVTSSERSQIEARVDGFVQQLNSLDLQVGNIRSNLKKPLRPLWVTQSSILPSEKPLWENFSPVILCTASRRVPGGEASASGYIQGAADDSESWAYGLTAPLFWKHKEELHECSEEQLPSLIENLVANSRDSSFRPCTLIKPTTQLSVGSLRDIDAATDKFSLIITSGPVHTPSTSPSSGPKHVHLTLGSGKIGSRQLRHSLPQILPLLDSTLQETIAVNVIPSRVLVASTSGLDHSIGIALAILCLYVTDSGTLKPRDRNGGHLSKQIIKQRLSWLMISMPDANPSRTTLQSVNAFLLG